MPFFSLSFTSEAYVFDEKEEGSAPLEATFAEEPEVDDEANGSLDDLMK